MTGQRQILLSNDPVPRKSTLVLTTVAHLIMLGLVVFLRNSIGPHVLPEKLTEAQPIIAGGTLAFNPPKAQPRPSLLHSHPIKMRSRIPEPSIGSESAGVVALRGKAKVFTAGLMADFKFRQTYGFSPGGYELPFQMTGNLPVIPASDLPSRYEQYLIVEVTIDTDGSVADARLVNGESTEKIEHTLLTAIREFKYRPATRNGTPIPSQVDIVVHIPS